jgi:hypothetical protein
VAVQTKAEVEKVKVKTVTILGRNRENSWLYYFIIKISVGRTPKPSIITNLDFWSFLKPMLHVSW